MALVEPRSSQVSDQEWFERLARIELEERRKRFRATTPGERLEQAFELSELGRQLREGTTRASQ